MDYFKEHLVLPTMLVVATTVSFIWLFLQRKKLNAKWWEIWIVSVLHTLIGVGFVKFFALMEAGFNAEKAGNMSMFGGIFFMPIVYFIYAKIKKLPIGLVFDIFTISLVSTLFFARVNCLISGCCYGIEINYTEYRYPTRETELIYDALFIGLSIFFIYKNMFSGKIFIFYLISYGFVRFVIEWFRYSESASPFHIGHVWALFSFIIGIVLLIVLYFKGKTKEQQ